MEPDQIRQLREAARLTPNNRPLRQALADALLAAGLSAEAVTEYRGLVAAGSEDPALKFGLARAFHADGKSGEALVVLEDLVKSPAAPARAFVLQARILAGIGEIEQAVEQYKRGVAKDRSAADLEFAQRLGIRAVPEAEPDAQVFRGGGNADEVVDGRVRESWEGNEDAPVAEIERPKITFADVGGMETLKEEIRLKIIYPLTHAEMFKAYGKSIGGGILMYGPPGCGKTHLARATAGEVKAGFIAVGIHDVLDM